MAALDWLTARPVAHRGLHDAAAGVIENMPAAFNAAIAGHYAIECDVQLSADGEAMVHHDFALGHLTEGQGPLASFSAAELKRVPFKATAEHMLTLSELCDLVGGRVPLIVEIKSNFDGALPLVQRTATVLQNYRGPAAAMSFDPNAVEALRAVAPSLTRGIVAERYYRHEEWASLSRAEKTVLGNLLHTFRTRPHFVAYWVKDLPTLATFAARHLFGLPLLTWTVRTPDDRARAARYASQIIFEGFRA
ncbi:MAG: glycerophosphodiester phosphodiesterase [Rhizobiales bacterium]|nr:glycerophosphodiester phosphodiesterase [Hyphomicrobiales bacterium]